MKTFREFLTESKQLNEDFSIKFKSLPGIVDFRGYDDINYEHSNGLSFHYDGNSAELYNPWGGEERYIRFKDWNIDDVKKLLKDHGYDIGKQKGKSETINDFKRISLPKNCFDSLRKELINLQKKYYDYFNDRNLQRKIDKKNTLDKKIEIYKDYFNKCLDNNFKTFDGGVKNVVEIAALLKEVKTNKELEMVKKLVDFAIKHKFIYGNFFVKSIINTINETEMRLKSNP